MYVCMYVCTHACMHACMYVCMYLCNPRKINGFPLVGSCILFWVCLVVGSILSILARGLLKTQSMTKGKAWLGIRALDWLFQGVLPLNLKRVVVGFPRGTQWHV